MAENFGVNTGKTSVLIFGNGSSGYPGSYSRNQMDLSISRLNHSALTKSASFQISTTRPASSVHHNKRRPLFGVYGTLEEADCIWV